MSIDRGSAEFEFEQLATILRRRIGNREYPPGSKMPPFLRLQEEFGLASMTVRRAVHVLADEGLLIVKPGRGTYVRDDGAPP